jgi:signal transduction histidine kinase
MPNADLRSIVEPARLAAVEESELLDSPASPALERLTRLTTKLLGVPSAVVSIVDRDRQFFAAATGLNDELARTRQTSLDYSFCQHVVAGASPLVVPDARVHPLVHDNLAIDTYGVQAYAGIPLVTSDGQTLGAFCAFDERPREWTAEELAVLRDLAQSAMTEIELRFTSRLLEEQGEQLAQLLDNTSEIVARVAPDGTLRYANAACRRVVGDIPLGADTTWLREHLTAPSRVALDAAWNEALERGATSTIALTFLPDGRLPVEVELRLIASFTHGQLRAMRLFGRDVTESRRVERMKDQMIGIVSHELRTPIGAVQGALQLLERLLPTDIGAKERDLIALAKRNGERLLGLVNDLLDIERLEGGKAMFDMRDVNLAEVFAAAQDAVLPQAERAGVTLECADRGARVHGDPARLAQVAINLLGNAVKFSPRGGTVRVDAVDEGAHWRVRVADQGRGIPAADIDRVFERFAQVARTDASEKGGTGLGLTIARAIVLQHEGRIWVESEEGQGSTFQFTLPRA